MSSRNNRLIHVGNNQLLQLLWSLSPLPRMQTWSLWMSHQCTKNNTWKGQRICTAIHKIERSIAAARSPYTISILVYILLFLDFCKKIIHKILIWAILFSNWFIDDTIRSDPPHYNQRKLFGILSAKTTNILFSWRYIFNNKHEVKVTVLCTSFFQRLHKNIIHETFIWAILFLKRFIDDIILIILSTANQLLSLWNFMSIISFPPPHLSIFHLSYFYSI